MSKSICLIIAWLLVPLSGAGIWALNSTVNDFHKSPIEHSLNIESNETEDRLPDLSDPTYLISLGAEPIQHEPAYFGIPSGSESLGKYRVRHIDRYVTDISIHHVDHADVEQIKMFYEREANKRGFRVFSPITARADGRYVGIWRLNQQEMMITYRVVDDEITLSLRHGYLAEQ